MYGSLRINVTFRLCKRHLLLKMYLINSPYFANNDILHFNDSLNQRKSTKNKHFYIVLFYCESTANIAAFERRTTEVHFKA